MQAHSSASWEQQLHSSLPVRPSLAEPSIFSSVPVFILQLHSDPAKSSHIIRCCQLFPQSLQDGRLLFTAQNCLLDDVGFGAAYGTAKSGVGIASMGVMRPELVMKSIVPVVMAGVLGIYGLIIAVIISTGSKSSLAMS